MNTETRWDLTVRRNDDVWERPLRIIGPNLTGVDMRAQIRFAGDTPGPPMADLMLVTNGNAEGIRLASAIQQTDGTWVNDVRVRLNKSTRQAFPYSGEVGGTQELEWGLLIAGVTRIEGRVFVPAQVYGSDGAPTIRPQSFGARPVAAPAASSGATLTISQDGGATLKIDGADLVGALVAEAKAVSATVKPLQGIGAPAASQGIDGSTYFDTTNPESLVLYGPKQNGQWGPGRTLKGNPGGNVMAVGLRVDVGDATAIPDGVGCIQFAGFRQNGQGAHQMFLWRPLMAELDPVGQGFWWITTNGGAKRWFIPRDQGTPEMIGAYADDGQFAHTSASKGTDDWVYLQKARDYFDLLTLPGKYRSSKAVIGLRPNTTRGLFGTEAGTYSSRVRFDRGCAGFVFHRADTNSDDTGKVPVITAARATGADGFYLGVLEIVMGQGDRIAYNGSNINEHAIWHKCRGTMQYMRVRGTMGDVVYGYNTAVTSDPMIRGNSNGSVVEFVRGDNVTGSVLHWDGADANASRSRGVNGAMTGGPCILEGAFLGNTHDTPQCANAGRDGFVYFGGFRWWCRNPALASTEQPGTGTAWFRGAVTALPDNWVSGKPYYYGGAYVVTGDTAYCVFVNPYIEGGSGPFMSLTAVDTQIWVIGGLLNGDGQVTGNLGWQSGSGLRIYGRAGVHAAFFNATFGYSGVGAQFTAHNTGAIGTTRGAAFQVNIGYEADGSTPHQVGRTAFRSGANVSAIGEGQIDLWNPATSTWDTKLLVSAAAISPGADNTISLGSPSRRFTQVYAGNATINTSDANLKTAVRPIDDALLDAWADVKWCAFEFDDAVAEKGDEARTHTGVVAQQVRDTLLAHGIDGTEYGFLCVDRWEDEWREWEDDFEDRPAVYATDDDGNLILDDEGERVVVTPAERVLIREAGRELIRAAGELWGVRYTEAFAVEAAYQRRRMDRIEARLAR
jgi:hypothetical protein